MSWILIPFRLAVASCSLAALASAQDAGAPRVPILSHAELTRELEQVARGSGGAATLVNLGAARSGRRIDALRLARGAEFAGRPAILVVGALDVELAWTSALVLDHARTLLARAATDDAARGLLESTTLWLVPCANPDAAERRSTAPRAELAATGPGVDDDRDGRNGEDGPADVDGDGVIGWMRVLDPRGEWLEDPTDPRALVKADGAKGQRGRWKLLLEARDADGDGEAGEDPPDDVLVNRNFPQGWNEHAPEAGRYATGEPEARALADFVVRHPEIVLVVTYGLLDNLAEKPKSKDDAGRRSTNPSEGIPGADANLLAEIGRRWKALGGTSGKTEARDAGTFQAWIQAQRGLWAVNLAPWSVPLDHKPREKPSLAPAETPPAEQTGGQPASARKDDEPKPSDDAKRLRWFDARPELAGFRPWTRIEHPDFEHVEVGGFAPFALLEPPPETRAEIADRTFALLTELASLLPRVEVAEARATDLGAGLWRVDAVLVNERLLPLASALGRRTRSVRPARVALELAAGATLVAGPRQELVLDLPGSGGRRELAWIVRTSSLDLVHVTVETDGAGAARTRPEEQR